MSHSSAEAPTTPISAIVSDLDYLAAEVMADWKVPGVALAVVVDGPDPVCPETNHQDDAQQHESGCLEPPRAPDVPVLRIGRGGGSDGFSHVRSTGWRWSEAGSTRGSGYSGSA